MQQTYLQSRLFVLVSLTACAISEFADTPSASTPFEEPFDCRITASELPQGTCEELATNSGGQVDNLEGAACYDPTYEDHFCLLNEPLSTRCNDVLGHATGCPTFNEFVSATGWLTSAETPLARAQVRQCDSALQAAARYDIYGWEDPPPPPDEQPYTEAWYQNNAYFNPETGVLQTVSHEQKGSTFFPELWCCEGIHVKRIEWGVHSLEVCNPDTTIVYLPADF